MQTEMALLGLTSPPMRLVSPAELRLLRSDGEAARLALQRAGMSQEQLAERLAKSTGYVSLLLTDQRNWPAKLLRQVARLTGCAAPLQRQASELGLEIYADEIKTRKAALLAELAQLEDAA